MTDYADVSRLSLKPNERALLGSPRRALAGETVYNLAAGVERAGLHLEVDADPNTDRLLLYAVNRPTTFDRGEEEG